MLFTSPSFWGLLYRLTLELVTLLGTICPSLCPTSSGRQGIVYDKWPFRLDIDTEYQDAIGWFRVLQLLSAWHVNSIMC